MDKQRQTFQMVQDAFVKINESIITFAKRLGKEVKPLSPPKLKGQPADKQMFQMVKYHLESIANSILSLDINYVPRPDIDYLSAETTKKMIKDSMPKKRIDYFTDAEVTAFMDRILKDIKVPDPEKINYEKIKDMIKGEVLKIPKPKDGDPGKDAEVDYDYIVLRVLSEIIIPDSEKVDYEKVKKFIKDELKKIPKGDAQIIRQYFAGSSGKSLLSELEDVNVTGVQDGDALIYSLSLGKWIPGVSTDTDEKVKYDASDPTAGYISDKFVAGTGITLTEGTGANENKLVITNSQDLSNYLQSGDNISELVNDTGFITNILGQDLSTADNSTSQFITLADVPAESDTLQTVTNRGATTTNTTTFSPSGNNNAVVANGSGSGIGIDVTHSGSGAKIRIGNGGSGAQIDGHGFDVDSDGDVVAKTLAITGGTSSQFLKADGSTDSNTYLTTETDPVFTASEAFNITATDITNLSNLSGINTGDQDLSGYALLDGSNQPFTGNIEIEKSNPSLTLTNTEEDNGLYLQTYADDGWDLTADVLTPGGIGNGVDFQSTQYGKISSLTSTASWTINYWIKRTGTTGTIINFGFGAAPNNSKWRLISTSPNNFRFNTYTNTGSGANSLTFTSTPDVWEMHTITYTGGTFSLYLNGNSTPATTITSAQDITTADLSIGAELNGTNQIVSIFDELIRYDRVLSTSEIATLYNSGVPTYRPITSGQLNGWSFDQVSGSTVTDYVSAVDMTLYNTPLFVSAIVPTPPSVELASIIDFERSTNPLVKGSLTFGNDDTDVNFIANNMYFEATEDSIIFESPRVIYQGAVLVNTTEDLGMFALVNTDDFPSRKLLYLKATVGQTGDLINIKNSADQDLLVVNSSGDMSIENGVFYTEGGVVTSSDGTSTIGASGANALTGFIITGTEDAEEVTTQIRETDTIKAWYDGSDIAVQISPTKLGFYGATPIARPTTGISEATFVENAGGTAVNVDSTFGGYTLQQIAQALKTNGLLT